MKALILLGLFFTGVATASINPQKSCPGLEDKAPCRVVMGGISIEQVQIIRWEEALEKNDKVWTDSEAKQYMAGISAGTRVIRKSFEPEMSEGTH